MNKTTATIVGTLFSQLADERYTLRTIKGIADKAGVTETTVCDLLADTCDFVTATRRSDGAALVGLGEDLTKARAKVLGALYSALGDTRYEYRTIKTIAEAAGVGEREVREIVAD